MFYDTYKSFKISLFTFYFSAFIVGSVGFSISSLTQWFFEMKKGCGLDEKGLIHGAKSLSSLLYLIGSSVMKSASNNPTDDAKQSASTDTPLLIYQRGLAIFIAGSVVNLLIEMYLFRKTYKAGVSLQKDSSARVELYRLLTSATAVLGAFFYLIGTAILYSETAGLDTGTTSFTPPSTSDSNSNGLLTVGGSSYTGSGVTNVAKNEAIKQNVLPQVITYTTTSTESISEGQFGLSRNPNAIHILENKTSRINWSMLSENPTAISLLERNLHKVDWHALSGNTSPDAIKLLEQYKTRIDWKILSGNKSALSLLTANLSCIDWTALSGNSDPAALALLKQYPVRINWSTLSGNESEVAVTMLEQNLSRVDWSTLSGNSKAISLLEKYPRRIDWDVLSSNPSAISLLERFPHKINWSYLSSNPSAIPFLEQKPFRIDWARLSENPNAIHLLEDSMHKIVWGNEVVKAGSESV